MSAEELPAMLAAIRENAEGLTASHYDDECEPGSACTGHEAIWMANALDAVLKLADELTGEAAPSSALEEDRAWVRAECAARFRETITRELTGEEKTDGQ